MSSGKLNSFLGWFQPVEAKDDPVLRQNIHAFVLLHVFGPLCAIPLFSVLFSGVDEPYPHVPIIVGLTLVNWLWPVILKYRANLFLSVTALSVQNFLGLIFFSAYNYGGVDSPFLIWLLSVPVAAFMVLGCTRRSLSIVFGLIAVNLSAFYLMCVYGGPLPVHVSDDVLSRIAIGSTISATLFVFVVAGYYATIVQTQARLTTEVMAHREKADELRHATELAVRANSAKSEFLANMSHELRTPLNAVLGYSEILLEDAELDGRTGDIADLQKISAAGKHLLSMVNDILDLSKIEAGKAELFLESFDLEKFVVEMESIARPLAAKNNNAFVLLKGNDLGEVHLDITKVRQSVLNLLSNAGKFTKNGQITLAVERRTVDGEARVNIEVRDTGVGISAANLDKMFRNFSQADSSITAQFGGTGLGLSLSRNLCRLMGGDITVQSVLNQGSCFTITLPAHVTEMQEINDDPSDNSFSSLTEEARQIPNDAFPERYHRSAPVARDNKLRETMERSQREQVLAARDPKNRGKRSVLVIDDDRNVLDVAERLLEREGFLPVCADSPESVLQLARTVVPYAIVLDILMPGLDGWDVIGTLKGDPMTSRIPVIMISNSVDREKLRQHDAVGFIEKPLSSEKLRSAFDNIRERSAA